MPIRKIGLVIVAAVASLAVLTCVRCTKMPPAKAGDVGPDSQT